MPPTRLPPLMVAALDELESSAYYLYYAQTGSNGGKRYWFHTKPNINILVNQAKSDIKMADIEAEMVKRTKEKTNKNVLLFHVLVDPSQDIGDQTKPTLILLHPRYTANPTQVSNDTKSLIEKIATKKGSTERIYRNTILFLVCSEIGVNKLQEDVRDYLACQKIRTEYSSQLEREQAEDIRKKMEDASKQSDVALAKAYSIVVKYAVKTGIAVLNIGEAKESLDNQINTNVVAQLKNEEWLLEAVGLGMLRRNNLLPTPTQSIKIKDVYETFLRFDDKPMITGENAVLRKIKEYCFNGEYAIATGNGTEFTRFFFKENMFDFDVKDETYWLVDKNLIPKPTPSVSEAKDASSTPESGESRPTVPTPTPPKGDEIQKVKSITVSGKVALEQYMQLFQSFVMPLAQNNIEIEIRIKGKSTSAKPLTTTSPEYKIVKESAKQLGLAFEEE